MKINLTFYCKLRKYIIIFFKRERESISLANQHNLRHYYIFRENVMNTHLIPFYSLFNCFFFFFFFFLYQYYKQFQAIPCFSICSSQQEFGFSTTFHTAFGFLILVLLTLLQVKYQMHGATMSLFYHSRACLCYSIGRDKPTKF